MQSTNESLHYCEELECVNKCVLPKCNTCTMQDELVYRLERFEISIGIFPSNKHDITSLQNRVNFMEKYEKIKRDCSERLKVFTMMESTTNYSKKQRSPTEKELKLKYGIHYSGMKSVAEMERSMKHSKNT